MYIPSYYAESDQQQILAFAKQHAFATIISSKEGVPSASHIPVMIEEGEAVHLYGHMAKANPQWQQLVAGEPVLVIFQGPHCYISPSYYTNGGVPTWNYTAVHMLGSARLIQDRVELAEIIHRLTEHHEQDMPSPATPVYSEKQLEMIVGFDITVERMEAQFKLSQNRSDADQQRIISNLRNSECQHQQAVAELMQKSR